MVRFSAEFINENLNLSEDFERTIIKDSQVVAANLTSEAVCSERTAAETQVPNSSIEKICLI